jgi:peptide/nickel transport system permease protein
VTLTGYIARRLLHMVPIALGVTVAVFLLLRLIPGDPALAVLGNHATPEKIALLHRQWGLDRSLPVQYEKFLGRVLHFDFGTSQLYDVPVRQLVVQDLPPTLWLLFVSSIFAVLIAVPLAALAALQRDRAIDHGVRAVPLVGLGFPPFYIGIMLLLLFGLNLGRLFPIGGYGSGITGHARSIVLPALTVALSISPILIRSLRAALLEVLESDYITTARSKGLNERRVLVHHALRNAVISTVSVLGVNVAYLVGGTVIVERVFSLGGVGQLMLDSLNSRDYPVVQAITLVFAILVVLVYLLTDVVHALLDPRVRFD